MISFFDGHVEIGRSPAAAAIPEPCATVPELLALMDRCGIADALVRHRASVKCARYGNRLLMEALPGPGRLYPCWGLELPSLQERDRPERLIADLAAHNVRAVHLDAEAGRRENLRELLRHPLLTALRKLEIPVFCSLGCESLDILCGEFPDLIVVNTMGYRGWLGGFLRRHPRLFVETSHVAAHNAIESLCREVGAGRLVFSSGQGCWQVSPGAAVNNLTAADISEAEKAAVASGNLRQLLKLPPAAAAPDPGWANPFIEPLRRGEPARSEVIVDAHAHTFTDEMTVWDRADARGMIAVMDRLGVGRACVAPNGSMCGGETEAANAINVRAVKAFPDRFVGYTRVDPNRPEAVEPLLRRNFQEAGIRHVKLHPAMNQYPVTGARYEPAFQFALEHNAVVLSHSEKGPYCQPAMFDEIAAKYPQLNIIIGHAGNYPPLHEETIAVMIKHPNVYTDTSGWCVTCWGVLEQMVARLGSERILFGTDFAAIAAPFQMGAIIYARIPLADKRNIMGLNAVRLFGLPAAAAAPAGIFPFDGKVSAAR